MLLVADSGSTKADWLLADNGKVMDSFSSIGFNPFFHSSKDVFTSVNGNKSFKKYASKIKEIYFFGAGCSSPGRNKIIATGLKQFFKNAKVTVDHDMLGAALAACNDTAGLVCILGTGSNIAYFDGRKLSATRHGLGYIMGDESSGSFYGRKLISYFLYGIMPPDISKSFYAKYKMTKEKMHKNVYGKPHANVYLASFAKFLSDEKSHPWIQQLVYKGMSEFFETNIKSYPQYKTVPVHFIGSIAYYFNTTLNKVAEENNFKVGKIIVKPVDHLMEYFLEKSKA
jgi:N-acetylglucosamine kinase-like BadF-type ATPase